MGRYWDKLPKAEKRKRREAGEHAELTFAEQAGQADLHDLLRIDQSRFGMRFYRDLWPKRPDFRLEHPRADIEVKAFTEARGSYPHFKIAAKEIEGLHKWQGKKSNGRPLFLAIYRRAENRVTPDSLRVVSLADRWNWDQAPGNLLIIPCSRMQDGPSFFQELKQAQLGIPSSASQPQALTIRRPSFVSALPQGQDKDSAASGGRGGVLDVFAIPLRPRFRAARAPRTAPWIAFATIALLLAAGAWAAWGRAIHPRSWTASRTATVRIVPHAPRAASAWARGGAIPSGEVAGFLQEYFPAGVSVDDVALTGARRRPDGAFRFAYAFGLDTAEPLLQAVPAPVSPGTGFRAFLDRLQYDSALPPGQKWASAGTMLYPAGTMLQGVLECSYDPATGAATADLPLLPGTTRAALDSDRAKASLIEAELARRYDALEQEIDGHRRQRLAQLPSRPRPDNPSFGGPGSGEPTKTGVRSAAGAAAGASIGALAGNNGTATGIGAASGLFAGLIYDAVSKANDRKRQEARVQAAYTAALRAYEDDVARANADIEAYATQRRDAFAAEIPSWNLPLLK